ncbi:hypothetical protein F5890DRAFT_1546610, partial [Lentinula detonsa]
MQLLPKTVSINAHNRQRVTHTNKKVIEELAKLDIDTILEMNSDIMKANRERGKKNIAHAQRSSNPAGSPMASLITVATKFFTDPLFLWFEQRNRKDKERESREVEDPDRVEDERRKSHVLPPMLEVRRDQTTPDNPTFCHELHEAGRHFQIPLSLFTTPRLAYISANAHGLKKIKLSCPILGINPKDPLDGLSFNEFRQAGRNLWQFEIKRDGIQDGSGIRASWTKAHFGFWDSKPEAEALYRDLHTPWLSICKITETSGARQ